MTAPNSTTSATGAPAASRAASAAPMAALAQAQALMPGSTLVGDGATAFTRVHTDTRTLQPGDLYVALRGDRFDGHDYLDQALAAGAAGAIVDRAAVMRAHRGISALGRMRERAEGRGGTPAVPGTDDVRRAARPPAGRGSQAEGAPGAPGLPALLVDDTLAALQTLATNWRSGFDLPLMAVTGSNGKTTVTQMVASILRAWLGDDAALATAGNLNNHIGVPLTLLRLRDTHRAAVVELGMNHPGEIAQLARIAAPTVALVNNAQREHLEFMTDVDAVARENGSVIAALPAEGQAVLPAADPKLPLWLDLAGGRRVWTFALDGDADVAAPQAEWDGDGHRWSLTLRTRAREAHATLRQAGRHNVANALAAAGCALAAGAPLDAVARGIDAFVPVSGRSQLLTLQRGDGRRITLIDDSYNANPDSVIAAIDQLAAMPAPRWLVLGDMGEVGDTGPALHGEVGEHARRAGIDHVWTAGTLAAHAGAPRHFADVPALLDALSRDGAPAAASILVKGSRFMRMERVVQVLREAAAPETPEAPPCC